MANFGGKGRDPEVPFAQPASSGFSFADFPEDVQLCILSFLSPAEISSFSSTSKRFNSLYREDSKLWFSLCDRRWGQKTQIRQWGSGKIPYKSLYRFLNKWESLTGFWRRIGHAAPLVFFEWGPSFITGSRLSPSAAGGYQIVKTPFLWMGISAEGEPLNYLDPSQSFGFGNVEDELGLVCPDFVQVSVHFVGPYHFVVEEKQRKMGSRRSEEDLGAMEEIRVGESSPPGSPPDVIMSEIYKYFANRTSPGGERTSRRHRKKERGKNGRRKIETEHYVKVVNCSPTSSRPLQGLWKGICEDSNLNFYLVAYDDIGGVSCRKVGTSSEPFSGYFPVFWTSNTTFLESPFSRDEEDVYEKRVHIQPRSSQEFDPVQESPVVLRILYINSSYDLVIPDLTSSSANPREVEGRIWQYKDGTFGFGFLRNNVIVDLKHIALGGHLLDAVEQLGNGPRI